MSPMGFETDGTYPCLRFSQSAVVPDPNALATNSRAGRSEDLIVFGLCNFWRRLVGCHICRSTKLRLEELGFYSDGYSDSDPVIPGKGLDHGVQTSFSFRLVQKRIVSISFRGIRSTMKIFIYSGSKIIPAVVLFMFEIWHAD